MTLLCVPSKARDLGGGRGERVSTNPVQGFRGTSLLLRFASGVSTRLHGAHGRPPAARRASGRRARGQCGAPGAGLAPGARGAGFTSLSLGVKRLGHSPQAPGELEAASPLSHLCLSLGFGFRGSGMGSEAWGPGQQERVSRGVSPLRDRSTPGGRGQRTRWARGGAQRGSQSRQLLSLLPCLVTRASGSTRLGLSLPLAPGTQHQCGDTWAQASPPQPAPNHPAGCSQGAATQDCGMGLDMAP